VLLLSYKMGVGMVWGMLRPTRRAHNQMHSWEDSNAVMYSVAVEESATVHSFM